MIAILSASEHDFYAMPLPFVVYSWIKAGVWPVIFIPKGNNPKLRLARRYCVGDIIEFDCQENKVSTYSQVIRLFGAAGNDSLRNCKETLITGDSDMCVFGRTTIIGDLLHSVNDGNIHVVGNDLTPEDQYPICFVAMTASDWIECMDIGTKTANECAAELIEPIQSTNLRGDAWSLDQWHLKKMLDLYKKPIVFHTRSNGENQFAQNRADRDGWHFNPDTLIDAHLPRPLTDPDNFQKVVDLFHITYPQDALSWM